MGGSSDNEVKETSAEVAAAEVAGKQWDLYQNELKGFEDTFMQRVDNFNSTQNMQDTKQSVDVAYAGQFSDARVGLADSMAASGVDPSSARFKSEMANTATTQSITQGDTVNRAQVGEQDKYVAGLQDITAVGMGQKGESLAGLGDTASMSLAKATNDANNDFNTRSANLQTAGAVAGAGLSYYNGLNNGTDTLQQMRNSSKGGVSPSPVGGYSSYGLKN